MGDTTVVAPTRAALTHSTARLRVVLAEDSPDSRALLTALLGTCPALEVVGAAADGAEAVELVAQTEPDLVLLDIAMPRMDGLEAASQIRRDFPATRIVVLSAYSAEKMAQSALAAGADRYLEKAAGNEALFTTLAGLFPDSDLGRGCPSTAAAAAAPAEPDGEHRFRTLLDALEEGVLVVDRDGVVVEANFAASRVLGIRTSRLVGRRMPDALAEPVQAGLADARPRSNIRLALARGVGERSLLVSVRPLRAVGDSRPGSVLVSMIDVTAVREGQEQLRAGEARLRAALDNLLDAFVIVTPLRDADGRVDDAQVVFANAPACAVFRRPLEDLVGQRVRTLVPSLAGSDPLRALAEVADTGRPYDRSAEQFVGLAGSFAARYDVRITRLGEQVGVAWRDVSERVQDRRRLAESEERYRFLTEAASDVILLLSSSGRLDYASPSAREVLGYPASALVGRSLYDLVEPDDVPLLRRLHQGALQGVPTRGVEHRLIRGDGSVMWCETVLRRVADEAGRVSLHGAMRDVTKRREAELALRESEEWFRTAMATLPDPLAVCEAVRDARGRLVDFRLRYANPAALGMAGVGAAGVVGRSVLEIMPSIAETGLVEVFRQVTETGVPAAMPYLEFNGRVGGESRVQGVFDARISRLDDGFLVLWQVVPDAAAASPAE